MKRKSINIEGYSTDEILAFSDQELEAFVFVDEPIVFKVGTAKILGEFKVQNNILIVELAQIDGGGEGILPLLFILVKKYAKSRKLDKIEWIVHALNCANPNPKLRPLMEKKGFKIKNTKEFGEAYYFTQNV